MAYVKQKDTLIGQQHIRNTRCRSCCNCAYYPFIWRCLVRSSNEPPPLCLLKILLLAPEQFGLGEVEQRCSPTSVAGGRGRGE
jgi:hypothetical protein